MISKTIQLTDYAELREGLAAYIDAWARVRGAGFDPYEPHEHRGWEYASTIQIAKAHFAFWALPPTAHNVGSGFTAFGVTLARGGFMVIESDPNPQVVEALKPLAEWADTTVTQWDLTQPRWEEKGFDLVTCISTVEHIPPDLQDVAWQNLIDMVAPGGLLIVTTDVRDKWEGERAERSAHFTMEDVAKRVEWLRERGFEIEADLTYHGPLVFDYSFFRFIATRPR